MLHYRVSKRVWVPSRTLSTNSVVSLEGVIEFTSIDISEIIENGDYIPPIEQPVPHVVVDPD